MLSLRVLVAVSYPGQAVRLDRGGENSHLAEQCHHPGNGKGTLEMPEGREAGLEVALYRLTPPRTPRNQRKSTVTGESSWEYPRFRPSGSSDPT